MRFKQNDELKFYSKYKRKAEKFNKNTNYNR